MKKYNKQFFKKQSLGSYSSATVIVPILHNLFKPKTVIDVGCGLGIWLKTFQSYNLDNYIGLDSHSNLDMLVIDKKHFKHVDLNTMDIKNNATWDIAMSLETAEHLQPSAAKQFVKKLVSLSNVVVFSAAIPYQGGRNHINECWQTKWELLFNSYGYKAYDIIRPQIWDNQDVEWWYAQNIIIYVNIQQTTLCNKLDKLHMPAILDIVHPRKYIAAMTYKHVNFKQVCLVLKAFIKKLFLTRAQRRSLYYVK